MSVINTNVKALVAQGSLNKVNRELDTAMQRLSTGKRINTAADDAAGLSISERMTSQIRGINMAIKNANDGISLVQTSEGAMDEVTDILQRMRELAVQSVNGTFNATDRSALDAEVQQLKNEIDRIATTTTFNNQKILDGSFKDAKLQIGDKAEASMDISIGSVKTSDLGMGAGSSASNGLISARVSLGAVDAGDIVINGQALGAITSSDDLGEVVDNINRNVDGVTASAFNTIVAKDVGTGIVSSSQLTIAVTQKSASAATTFTIQASTSMDEMVENINDAAGGVLTASLNDAGKLVIENTDGAKIVVTDSSGSGAGFGTTSGTTFMGFLKLESDDGSAVSIERGNLGLSSPGSLSDLAKLGFREVTTELVEEGNTLTGLALTSAGVATAWASGGLMINGTNIYDSQITTTSFAGKLQAINNFTEETGVMASAFFEKSFTIPTAGFVSGKRVELNGVVIETGASVAAFKTNINAKTTEHGLVATVNGDQLILSGANVQKTTVEYVDPAYGNTLASTITSTTTINAVRKVSLRSADVVTGRTLQLAIATSAGSGSVAVTYTIGSNDTKTSVAAGLRMALLDSKYTWSGGMLAAANTKYLGTATGTVVTAGASGADLQLSGAGIGGAAISLSIVDTPSNTIGNYQTSVAARNRAAATARAITFDADDIVTGGVYELRIVSGELVGPTGSSGTLRVTSADGTSTDIATQFEAAFESAYGAFQGQPNSLYLNGQSTGAAAVAGSVLTIAANTGYGRATIFFNRVDEVLGAADTHYGAIRLDSKDNSPISIALGSSNAPVGAHGLLEQNVGAADYDTNSPTLGGSAGSTLTGLNVATLASASKAISAIDNAINDVLSIRSNLGAVQNRLEHTVDNLSNVVENTSASLSRIQDTDYAKETSALARAQIIQQAATAMLAQANQQPQTVLALLQ